MLQCPKQAVIVPLVQPDARLIENVEHPHESGTDLRRQPDALRLPPRQCPGRTGKGEIIQTHIQEEAQPCMNFFQNLGRNFLLPFRQFQILEKGIAFPYGHLRDLMDILPPHRHGKRLRLQPRAMAGIAGDIRHIVLVGFTHLIGIRFLIAAGQEGHDPFKGHMVFLVLPKHIRIVKSISLLPRAVQ